MLFSLVVTVLNEEDSIGVLLGALDRQTKRPDEIIFVDGGSIDNTYQLLVQWAFEKDSVRVFVKNGLGIAQGRNFGIRMAKGNVIVHTDAGCVPHRDWFEKITQPFKERRVDVVSGFYRMIGESPFQKCLGLYFGIPFARVNSDNFLPSTRSIAFKRNVWVNVGGFSESLRGAGEDTLFNYVTRRSGAKFYFQGNAIVDWKVPGSLRGAIKKFYFYAKGDGQVKIWWHPQQGLFTHSLKIFSIYARYFMGLVILLLAITRNLSFWVPILVFIFYLIWAVMKNYSLAKTWEAVFWLPVIQIVSDVVVMVGFAVGILSVSS